MTPRLEDARRAAAIRVYDILDRPVRRELLTLTQLAGRVVDVPMATINLITDEYQHQVATVGFDAAVCARGDSMCATTIREGAAILLSDASRDPRFVDNPFITGEIGTVRFYASHPLVTPGGVTIGTLCVFDTVPHPVTDDLRDVLAALAQQVVDVLELELATRRLRAANTRLVRFAGQVSHDLKNPLATVAMALSMIGDELAQEEPEPDAVEPLVDKASRSTGRMRRMIDDLLVYAETGAAPVLVEVPVAELVSAVVEDLGDALAGRVDVEVPHHLVAHADPTQLRVVVQNLLANSAKFTRPDVPPVVTVAAESHRGGVRISIADNGRGVPPEERERIFDPLVRLDAQAEGSGIGLATVRSIVVAHRGTIEVDETPGGGATFEIELPGPPR